MEGTGSEAVGRVMGGVGERGSLSVSGMEGVELSLSGQLH